MGTNDPRTRGSTLTQAASLVFALVAVIPLLLFVYSLYTLNALGTTRYRVVLILALGVALFGLYILRLMVGRMSDLIRAVPRPAPMNPAVAGPQGAGGGPSPEGGSAPGVARILGIGLVQEFGDLNEILNQMWRSQAWPHMGGRVKVSLRDARPLAGTLVQLTPESVVLDVDGRRETVTFQRMSAIEPEPAAPSDP